MCLTDCQITECQATAYAIPTDAPESDGTLQWSSTTIVVVQIQSTGGSGLGYSYTDRATADLINHKLLELNFVRGVRPKIDVWPVD